MSSAAPDVAAAALEAARSIDDRARVRRGIAILVGSAVCFGTMAICVRVARRDLAVTLITFVRFLGSFLVLLALAGPRRLIPKPGNTRRVLARGVLGWLAIVCYFEAIGRVGAGLATILQCMYPLSTAVFAVLVFGETAPPRLPLALVANVVGITLVSLQALADASVDAAGVAFGLTGAVFAGAAVATAQDLRSSEDASLITIYFMGVGTILTAMFLPGSVTLPSATTALALAGVVVTSAGGQWLLHHGLGFTPASLGSLASATSVLTTAVLQAVLLDEHLGWWSVAGAACMVAAIGLAASRRRT